MLIPFPNNASHDNSNRVVRGHSTNIYYSEDDLNKLGDSPEILISIRGNINSKVSSIAD